MGYLIGLMMLPMAFARGRRYHEWQLVSLLIGAAAACVWLAAPIAIWSAFGMAWTLLWLVPTGAMVCLLGLSRGMSGGG